MQTVDQIIGSILQREGWPTVTNRPADKGGLTKGGITYNNYKVWSLQKGRPINPTDFLQLSEEQAREFLLESIGSSLMPVDEVDNKLFALLFDWSTTSGPDDPTRALQAALRVVGTYQGKIDGVYGPKTDTALKMLDHEKLVTTYGIIAKARAEFYLVITLRDPAIKSFREQNPTTPLENVHGWLVRALEFL